MRIEPISSGNIQPTGRIVGTTPKAEKIENTVYYRHNNDYREPDISAKNDDIKLSQRIKLLKKLGIIKCRTCESRKYMDKSNESNVSFKTPTNISPSESFYAVISHEMEHVANSKAEENSSEEKEIVNQSVKIFIEVCPECGRTYVSGGETNTDMRISESDDEIKDVLEKSFKRFENNKYNNYIINEYV